MTERYEQVNRMYTALYCGKSFEAFAVRAGGCAGDLYGAEILGHRLTLAALECCGHPTFRGAVQILYAALETVDDNTLSGLAMEHLLAFATEQHIISLGAK